jgi:release factor glutamine methyltransferase
VNRFPPEGAGPVRPPAPTRREILDGLSDELSAAGIETGRHEAERLVAHALGISRSELILAPGTRVEPEEAGRIADLVRRRLAGVPLQHLEGTVAFRDLVLLCDDRALVPRPETEQLVQEVVDWASGSSSISEGVRRVVRPVARPPVGTGLDIGTGSGAIALALLQEGVVDRAVAVDISSRALDLARENARRLGLEERVEFRHVSASPWEGVAASEAFDLIVSNPPYIAEGEIDSLAPEVRDHDPREALSGGGDGLDVVRQIAVGARAHLRSGGALFVEIGAGQGAVVKGLLEDAGGWAAVRVREDLAGRERFVLAIA